MGHSITRKPTQNYDETELRVINNPKLVHVDHHRQLMFGRHRLISLVYMVIKMKHHGAIMI